MDGLKIELFFQVLLKRDEVCWGFWKRWIVRERDITGLDYRLKNDEMKKCDVGNAKR